MAQYIVRAKNQQYNGKAVGVRFNNGEAFVNDYTIDKRLGKNLAAVIGELSELGYVIQEVPGEAARVAAEFRGADGKSAFPITDAETDEYNRERLGRMSVGSPTRVQEQVDPDTLTSEIAYQQTLRSPVHTEAPAGARVQEQVDPDPVQYIDEETREVVVPAADKENAQTVNPKGVPVMADGKITADETPNAAVPMEMQRRNAVLNRDGGDAARESAKRLENIPAASLHEPEPLPHTDAAEESEETQKAARETKERKPKARGGKGKG